MAFAAIPQQSHESNLPYAQGGIQQGSAIKGDLP
jgi:hypothetical protein